MSTAIIPAARAPYGWGQDTPADFYDQPFFYVFDADNLTDSQDYQNLVTPVISQGDFILRRVCGLPNVASAMRFRDKNQFNRQRDAVNFGTDYAVVPEIVYPSDSQINFDLVDVTRANTPNAEPGSEPNYYSQIGFMGVRRFYGQQAPRSTYRYHSRPYTITTSVTITETGRLSPAFTQASGPVPFNILVDSYDFELQCIHAMIQTDGEDAAVACTDEVKITLFDQNQQALSNAPVLAAYLADNGPDYSSVFPCPPLLYQANSLIRFNVTSLLTSAQAPATLTLDFIGAWRFPC